MTDTRATAPDADLCTIAPHDESLPTPILYLNPKTGMVRSLATLEAHRFPGYWVPCHAEETIVAYLASRPVPQQAEQPGVREALPVFEQEWAKKEAEGYRYGDDALEQVRFGFEIALQALAAQPVPQGERTPDVLRAVDEREAFERWADHHRPSGLSLRSGVDGTYEYPLGRILWECWQARASLRPRRGSHSVLLRRLTGPTP